MQFKTKQKVLITDNRRSTNLSELTPIVFNIGLSHLSSKASIKSLTINGTYLFPSILEDIVIESYIFRSASTSSGVTE